MSLQLNALGIDAQAAFGLDAGMVDQVVAAIGGLVAVATTCAALHGDGVGIKDHQWCAGPIVIVGLVRGTARTSLQKNGATIHVQRGAAAAVADAGVVGGNAIAIASRIIGAIGIDQGRDIHVGERQSVGATTINLQIAAVYFDQLVTAGHAMHKSRITAINHARGRGRERDPACGGCQVLVTVAADIGPGAVAGRTGCQRDAGCGDALVSVTMQVGPVLVRARAADQRQGTRRADGL